MKNVAIARIATCDCILSKPKDAITLFSLLTTRSTATPNKISGAISNNLLSIEYIDARMTCHFHGFA